MQVDRPPSPWPCVAMLVGLLLLCLVAPRYWRNEDAGSAIASDREASFAPQPILAYAQSVAVPGIDVHFGSVSANNHLLDLWSRPTLEELIAARVGRQHPNGQPVYWPLVSLHGASGVARAEPSDEQVVVAPQVKELLESVGRATVRYAPVDLVPRVYSKLVSAYHRWSAKQVATKQAPADTFEAKPAPLAASTLRLVNPDDRIAMLPKTEPRQNTVPPAADPLPGQAEPEEVSHPWCVPDVLLEQLKRLAGHPFSADWARETLEELQALTHRRALGEPHLQNALAVLSDLTQQAFELAEATADDRLRVELLRAAWGLARRLDCWAALHDIQVAAASQGRLAARDSVGVFFEHPRSDVAEAAPGPQLTAELEAYERDRDPQLAREVARKQRALESSPTSFDRALGDAVEQHYRNANVRIAITAELLNRLIGQQRSDLSPVHDRIAGTPVRGQSHTLSNSRVRLDPATGRWQLAIETEGVVSSSTLANGGQARLRSQGTTEFAAQKSLAVDPHGVRLQPTNVEATNHNRLMGVTTDFDWVPLFGAYARDRAVAQYRARRGRAKAEVEMKVSAQALEQIDRQTLETVERVERQVRETLVEPLAEAGIDLTPIEMTTTRERLVARLRVAGEHQLGSHTPRPRALSDSLASVQIHETALTNAALSLGLDGRSFSADELQSHFQQKFPGMATQADRARRDVMFHFADEDAVVVRITEGRLDVTMRLAALEQDGRTIRDFAVHAYYTPVVDGLEAELARDGVLGIEGRLSSSERARLHNVFNSVLLAERRFPLVELRDPSDPRLAGLMITQLVLEDGWFGLAIGPGGRERVAERSRSLR